MLNNSSRPITITSEQSMFAEASLIKIIINNNFQKKL